MLHLLLPRLLRFRYHGLVRFDKLPSRPRQCGPNGAGAETRRPGNLSVIEPRTPPPPARAPPPALPAKSFFLPSAALSSPLARFAAMVNTNARGFSGSW